MRIAMVLVVLSLTNAVRLFGQETRTPPEVRATQSGSLVELQTLNEVEGGQLLEGRELEYPRFLCYECHTYARIPAWDPYRQSCTRFQVIRYDEPAYQAASAYGNRRIVYNARVVQERGDTVAARPQPRLRRRNPTKPDTSGTGEHPV